MSIVTCHVSMSWADDAMRVTAASFGLKINDPRVLLAGHRILLDQPAVTAADLVSGIGIPYFAVALGSRRQAGQFDNPVVMAQGWLDGEFVAWALVLNAAVDRLEPLNLRLKMEVIG